LNLKELLRQASQPSAASPGRRASSVFRYGRHALALAWTTNRSVAILLAVLARGS